MKTAAILAGGRGERLRPLTDDIPKPMVEIAGKPLLEHHVRSLAAQGFSRVFLLTGYKSEVIETHFGDGSRFGLTIHHLREASPLGSGGALNALRGRVTEDFMLLYGDVYVDADLQRMARFHTQRRPMATLAVHPTDHPEDSDLVLTDHADGVLRILRKPHRSPPPCNLGNAALLCLSPALLEHIPDGFSDLTHDVLPVCLTRGARLAAYRTPEYIKDMGAPSRLARVRNDVAHAAPAAMTLRRPRPAVFLDRDNTIVRAVDLLHKPEDLELLPDAGPAIARLNTAGLLTVLVTNQSVVARNLCAIDDVVRIHDRLELLLAEHDARLDLLRFCPHHPDAGYPEENPAFKITCGCRKPEAGMLLEAADHLHIDLARSWTVGDSECDVLAGEKAGSRTILLSDTTLQAQPDFRAADLAHAVDIILRNPS